MKLPNGYGSVVKLSGKRRRPYQIRKTASYHYDAEKGQKVQKLITIGYAATRAEGLQLLAEYNRKPFDTRTVRVTFSEVYESWSSQKYETASESNIKGYKAAYKICGSLYGKVFKDIRLSDLQIVIDTCGKNYPTMKKIKILFNQLYKYAMQNDICSKDYSAYINIIQYRDRNPNKYNRGKFEKAEIARIWEKKDDKYYQIILMLLYNGTRISEFLDLKKVNVHLDEQYFEVVKSKTDNGIRKVPIPDALLQYYKSWYDSCPECEYLLHTEAGKHFKYKNYFDSYYMPLLRKLGINRTPHCCRHTCISLLSEARVSDTIIKKIVGHAGAMTLTEKVYTHIDMEVLIDAVNSICVEPG